MIKINKPYIIDVDNKSRLESVIEIDSKNIKMYYQVDSKYKEKLCSDRADSFVVALLHYAMRKGKDIKSEAPISEKLHYNLTEHVIPSFSKYLYKNKIDIITDRDMEIAPTGEAVGTGISSGVDSFHTILSHIIENNLILI